MKNFNFNLKFLKTISLLSLLIVSNLVTISSSEAFPIYAQNAYANPREANGRIACANCHLAQKVTEVEADFVKWLGRCRIRGRLVNGEIPLLS